MKELLMESTRDIGNNNINSDSTTVFGEIVEEEISLSRFSLLVDLYHYYPVLRKQDKNISTELFYILSSNKRGQALHSSLR